MYLKLVFRDLTAPAATAQIATAEAVVTGLPYNSFQIPSLPLALPCESLEFRLHDRKLDRSKIRTFERPFNIDRFDCRLKLRDSTLQDYFNYMIDNLALEYDRRPESLRVTATTYPLNGNFTGTFLRSGAEWRQDQTQPHGQQPEPA